MKAKHYLAAAALLLTMATATQAATPTPTVTYTKGGTTSTLTFTSANTDALKDATAITATGTWTPIQVDWLKVALDTGMGTSTKNTTLLTADLSAAVWNATTSYNLTGLFRNCTALTTVKLPAGGAASGATFSQAFMGCTSLTSVTNLDKFTNVSSFLNIFSDCTELQSVTLSPSGSSAATVDFSAAFQNCSKLTSVMNLDKFTNVSGFNSVFNGCEVLQSVTLSPSGSSATDVSFSVAFKSCSKLTSVVNLDKFKNVEKFSQTFYNCSALESVTLPEGSTATDISFEQAFYKCSNLTSIVNLEKFKNVRNFGSAFYGCALLESVTLPEGSTVNAAISFSKAFYGCEALTSIANLEKYTKASNFDQTFRGCKALKDITLPVPAAPAISINFQYAFSGCTALERVANLGEYKNVSSLSYTFYQCSNLTYAMLGNIPNTITGALDSTNPNCLIYVPDGTNVSTIPTGWKNVIVDGKATGNITLKDKNGSDYCPFYCPQAFSMGEYTMTYKRTWTYATKDGGWNTLCLPFAATAQEMYSASYHNMTPATADADGKYLLKALVASPDAGEIVLANAPSVEAYKPYLVALPGSSFGTSASLQYSSVRFVSAPNATIGKTPDTQQPLEGSQYTMYGTLSDYQADNLYLLYNEKTGSTITGSSFELYADGGGVHPFRAYIKANTANALSAPRLVIKGGDDGATGIREASVGTSSTEVPAVSYVYSIDGRLLRTVPASEYGQRLDGLDRGIYIVNGVKEVVR